MRGDLPRPTPMPHLAGRPRRRPGPRQRRRRADPRPSCRTAVSRSRRSRPAPGSGARWRSAASAGSRASSGGSRTSWEPSAPRSSSRRFAPGGRPARSRSTPTRRSSRSAGWRFARARSSTCPCRRLRTLECFLELDPGRLGKRALQAASIRGAERLGRSVGIEGMPPIDLIVCGAVAVNARGARVGKGGGFSDLEYGLLVEAGRVGPRTPIVTTVHPVQVLPQAIEMQTPRHPGRRGRHRRRADGPPAGLSPARRPVSGGARPGPDRRGAGHRATPPRGGVAAWTPPSASSIGSCR